MDDMRTRMISNRKTALSQIRHLYELGAKLEASHKEVGMTVTGVAETMVTEINKMLDPAYSPATSRKAPLYLPVMMAGYFICEAPYTKCYVCIITQRNSRNFYVQEQVLVCDYNKPAFVLTNLTDLEASVKAVLGL